MVLDIDLKYQGEIIPEHNEVKKVKFRAYKEFWILIFPYRVVHVNVKA